MKQRLVLVLAIVLGLAGALGLVAWWIQVAALNARMERPASYGPNEIWDPVPQSFAPWPLVMQVSSVAVAVSLVCVLAVVVASRAASRRQ